jgi:prepilin-type N-terminal cleavage/methylation domain-containing protein
MSTPIGTRAAAQRPARRLQRGFTLIEMVVTMGVVTLLMGAIAGSFSVASKIMRPGGAQDRLAAAQDGMVLEQVLSRDVSRAACIKVGAGTAKGTCSVGFANTSISGASGACSAVTTVICVAWPWLADPAGASCRVAAYTKDSASSVAVVRRVEWRVVSGTATSMQTLRQTTNPVGFTVGPLSSGAWSTVVVTATVTGNLALNNPSVTLALRPLAADPNGPAIAALVPAGAQC